MRSVPSPVFETRGPGEYVRLLEGFRSSGGVWSGDQVVLQMRDTYPQPLSTLARWIVGGTLLSFEWRSHILVPMFQFEVDPFTPRGSVGTVLNELSEAFDDWELAAWFASPNCWLHGATPAEELARDGVAVVHAARADRFIALG
jgi:hypothetical protein